MNGSPGFPRGARASHFGSGPCPRARGAAIQEGSPVCADGERPISDAGVRNEQAPLLSLVRLMLTWTPAYLARTF